MKHVPNFRYRALTQNGEIVNGTISAPTSDEVARRIEYLRLLPIETIEDKRARCGFGRALACSAGRVLPRSRPSRGISRCC